MRISHSELSKYRGPALILIASLLFSTTGTAQALSPPGATSFVIAASRLWLGFIFLLLWCAWRSSLPSLKNWPKGLTLLAALGIVSYQFSFFAAVSTTGVAIGTVVVCGCCPIASGAMAFLLLKEKPERIWYIATFSAIVGLALLSLNGKIQTNPLGLFLAVWAAFSYSTYAVLAKKLLHKRQPEHVIMVLFGIGAILATPIFFMFPTSWLFTLPGGSLVLYLGLAATALGYTAYLAGLKSTPVATAATINLSESVAAACWGLFILGEQLTPLHLAGMALIFSSTVLLTVKIRQR